MLRKDGGKKVEIVGFSRIENKMCVNSFVFVSFLIGFFLFLLPWLATCTIRRAMIGTVKLVDSGSGLLLALGGIATDSNRPWIPPDMLNRWGEAK